MSVIGFLYYVLEYFSVFTGSYIFWNKIVILEHFVDKDRRNS